MPGHEQASIIHLDTDAFFASAFFAKIKQAADPRLRGRPVAVGGATRGVVASASYEVRRLGIFTTMPTTPARKVCPNLLLIPGGFEKYERFSRLMFSKTGSCAYDHTPMVEVASIDEGYFDLRGNGNKSAWEVAGMIRDSIQSSLKISLSLGVASNKLVSAIASKFRKPSAFLKVAQGEEREFLAPLENKWLPGVGPKLAKVLNQAGLVKIGHIARMSPQELAFFVGNQADYLWELAQGIDGRRVIPESSAAKSYSEQETFETDIMSEGWIAAKLRSMADRLLAKVRSEGKTIRTVEV